MEPAGGQYGFRGDLLGLKSCRTRLLVELATVDTHAESCRFDHVELPTGEGFLKRPPFFRSRQREPSIRFNHRIRAREVRVIGPDGQQVGVMATGDALELARQSGLDLVEVSANADPPVCRIVDYGKFKYQEAKKEKDSKKHHHANKVKEIQLRPGIDPHDFQTKFDHAVDFLCDDMKVKVALRFRGREMAHTEIGFEVIKKFINEIGPWGHPDFDAKLVGRAINVMISPLPRNKRAKNPSSASREPDSAPGRPKHAEPAHDAPAPSPSPAPGNAPATV